MLVETGIDIEPYQFKASFLFRFEQLVKSAVQISQRDRAASRWQ
jgi:hypothetical protein